MPLSKPRPALPPAQPNAPPDGAPIPDAQQRALDRRHALDAQQRTFDSGVIPAPHLWSRRPPG